MIMKTVILNRKMFASCALSTYVSFHRKTHKEMSKYRLENHNEVSIHVTSV